MKFRKKPVVIEAVQFKGDISEVYKFSAYSENILPCSKESICIETLEGTMVVSPGDWIVKGHDSVNGYHYWPVEDSYFREHYEPVEESK